MRYCLLLLNIPREARRQLETALVRLRRHLETLIVAIFVFIWIIMPVVSLWLPIFILFTNYWWTVPLYALWTWYDWDTPKRGSRELSAHRNLFFWKWFASYFPMRLIKTSELDPDRNYIIGSHPHGILSVGAFITLLTNGTGFSSLFPGIQSIILTLNGQFYFPFRRDIGICLGGLSESLLSRPHTHNLKLKDRRGFCRFALQHGADLVPLYHFGENEIYDQHIGTCKDRVFKAQSRIRRLLGFCPPLPKGVGLLSQPHGGVLPYRRPITSVMGAPIRVERVEQPSEEQIELLHMKYSDALVDLFEKHKNLHGIPEEEHLNFY